MEREMKIFSEKSEILSEFSGKSTEQNAVTKRKDFGKNKFNIGNAWCTMGLPSSWCFFSNCFYIVQ